MSSVENEPEVLPFVVDAPFNDKFLADIVLRSSDGVDFFVSKSILSFASPFFRAMVELPVPSSSTGESDQEVLTKDGLPVIIMDESTAPVLDAVLRILYPDGGLPALDDIDIALGVTLVADKYEMARVSALSERALLTVDMSGKGAKALEISLMCRARGSKVTAQHFALEWLKNPFPDTYCAPVSEGRVSASDIWRVFDYRKRVENQISALFKEDLSECNRTFYDKVEILYKCSNDCGRASSSYNTSRVWTTWRASVLETLHERPLANDTISFERLTEVASETGCDHCGSRIKGDARRIIAAFKEEIIRRALEVRSNLKHSRINLDDNQ